MKKIGKRNIIIMVTYFNGDILRISIIICILSFFTTPLLCQQQCEPIHSRAWGMTIVCCGPAAPLPDDCKYKGDHLCTFNLCTCSLIVEVDNVHCSETAPIAIWKDHDTSDHGGSPFACRNPNFPNSGDSGAEFTITLRFDTKTMRNEFYLGLSRYKIAEMEISFKSTDELTEAMFTYFPSLKRLKFYQISDNLSSKIVSQQREARKRLYSAIAPEKSTLADNALIFLPGSVANLKYLEALTIQNISQNLLFYLPENALFSGELRYLHISHCGLRRLPGFLRNSTRLEYLKITRTNLTDVQYIGDYMPALKLCFLSHNKIQDLSGVTFMNSLLKDLDLSYNEITILSMETFAGLTSLTFLDLSNNRLKRLPPGVFYNLRQLKWLYLHHDFSPTKLNDPLIRQDNLNWKNSKLNNNDFPTIFLDCIGAQHLIGLSNLEYLSVANNPNIKIEPNAFYPLENLLSLDLKHCNLSVLPEALIDLCRLKYLYLNFNNLAKDSSFPRQIFAHLAERLDEADINENTVDENSRAFFLIPANRISLVDSILFALKQQSVWWNDRCAPYHWWLHLVAENRSLNSTLKTYYQRKFAFSSNITLSARDKLSCNATYSNIMREAKAYEKLVEYGTCYKIGQEKSVNHNLRRQLVTLSHSYKKINNNNNNSNKQSNSENSEVDIGHSFENNSNLECRPKGQFNDTQVDSGQGNCQHLYDNVNLLGYLLAVNFAVLLIVCLCCVVTFCKRQTAVYAPANTWRD